MQDVKHILVAVDGSPNANKAAAFAASMARATKAAVTLIHVHQLSSSELLGMVALTMNDVKRAFDEYAQVAFEGAMTAMDGFPAETIATAGDPTAQIVAHAEQLGVGLIILGSRGLSPLQGLLLGSVSDKVCRHAHCPVVVMR